MSKKAQWEQRRDAKGKGEDTKAKVGVLRRTDPVELGLSPLGKQHFPPASGRLRSSEEEVHGAGAQLSEGRALHGAR